MTDPETITRYWFLLENLIPHKVLTEEKEYKRIDLSESTRANALLPWLAPSPPEEVLAVNPDELDCYYYQVYLGIFHERESCDYIESLELPGPDGFEENEPQNRLYYSASFQIDSAGIVNGGSLSISMFPWTLERVRGLLKDRKEIDPGEWLQDYSQYQNFLKNDFSALAQEYARNQDVIECEQLVELLKLSCRGMWQTETASVCGYYKTQVVKKDNRKEPPEQILNSFYLEDLRRATVALEEGKASRPLVHYLSGQQAQRINAEERSFLDRNLTPDCLGLGRWPSKPEHNLSLMQQLAVNLALRELPDGGLFSVNGPPGTGKTTLLRDAIADLIVQRAAAMARYEDPSKAFTRGRDGVFKLDDALTGFEIVVASSNNGAVENISAELPTRSALAPEYRERADYFAEVSETIRGVARREGKVTSDSPTWGLLAAVLGNSKNRNIFAKGFWFDKATSTTTTITNVFDEEPSQWDEALRSFAECQLTVKAEITRRQQYWQDARRQALLLRQQQELNATFQSLQDAAHQANVRSELDERSLQQVAAELSTCEENLRQVRANKPPFWARLFARSRFRAHARAVEEAQQQQEAAREQWTRQQQVVKASLQVQADVEQQLGRIHHDLEGIERELLAYSHLPAVKGELGKSFADADWWAQRHEDIQLSAPWLDRELNEARNQLFFAALEVHKQFILSARSRMRSNLSKWIKHVVTGEKAYGQQETLALWQTFFLVVPVVSTTFASFGHKQLFGNVPVEGLGWLLIDEAGQGVPQAAVGALQRVRRAIAVGDPLQIWPVFTLEQSLERGLRQYFKVDDRWSPMTASIQSIFDAANPYGTEIQLEEEPLWVGCPLWVHRRCLDPMFAVSNEIAYSGRMVTATVAPQDKVFPLGDSGWFDVGGVCTGRHWVPEQGEAVLQLLAHMVMAEQKFPNLYVISPFKEVKNRLLELLKKEKKVWARTLAGAGAWMERSVGTIHTFQGKEADAVILLLGADRSKTGAIGWASGRPNILNVAVTRAKYRFYVVGDRALWSGQRHFDVASARLPVKSLNVFEREE